MQQARLQAGAFKPIDARTVEFDHAGGDVEDRVAPMRVTPRVLPRAVLCAAVLAAACSGPTTKPRAGERTMTRRTLCFELAYELCAPKRGCLLRHHDDEYACRAWFNAQCCENAGTCHEQVTVKEAQLSECKRLSAVSSDCAKIYTPACFHLLPAE